MSRQNIIGRFAVLICVLIAVCSVSSVQAEGLRKYKKPPKASNFQLTSLDGKHVKLSSLKGKVVVVNFWATWCPPCRAEIPSMIRAWKKLKGRGVVMLGVHVGGKKKEIRSFARKYRINFPVLIDAKQKVFRSWSGKALPMTYIVNKKGRIVYDAKGDRKWDDPAILKKIVALSR
ncbi:MAG: TlpA family protein disulfide reductase [Magnetovibrio sp.]|nr:TlpA family protein disulfide reductase [Magnetovibrio sp.]